jgi:hypothetical protein
MNRSGSTRRWGTAVTIVFSVMMTFSGALFLASPPKVLETIHALGYPDYVARLLGVAKLLGVAALWLPVSARVREWAYAGFVFNLLGAVVSHLAGPGPRWHAFQPMLPLVLLTLSYLLRQRGEPAPSTPRPFRAKLETAR